MLRKDEMKHLAAEGKACDGTKIDDIEQIIPVSVEMIAMMESIDGEPTTNEYVVS